MVYSRYCSSPRPALSSTPKSPTYTPFAATDSQGNIEWQIDHYPYGGEYSNTQVARKNDISFAGKPYDEEIGLSYFGARWYDPATGRFTGIDPMPVDPNDYRTFNRYAYAFNNPYKYQDPDGRLAFLIPVAIFLAKELAAEAASQATGGATDFLSVRRLSTKAVKFGAKQFKNRRNSLARNKGCCCFDEGTPIKTESGFLKIEEVKVGDLVYSYDEESGETLLKPVTELFITDPKPLYNLTLKDALGAEETFVVTDNHPFWVLNKGWVDSSKLTSTMKVMSFEGEVLDVAELVLRYETKQTYNFTVADTHTYFAGESEALVHNCNCASGSNRRVNSAGQPINSRGQFTSGAGGDTAEAARGRAAHDAFDAKVRGKADQGWVSQPRIVDANGNTHIPDALTPSGRPIEYKPNTPSGIKAGRRQLKRYERVTGKRGRLLTYD